MNHNQANYPLSRNRPWYYIMAVILLSTISMFAQQQTNLRPDCEIGLDTTVAAGQRSIAFDNRYTACTTWHLVYTNFGFTSPSIELDFATDSNGSAGSWSVWPNVDSSALPLTSATESQITLFKFHPWVSINLNSATGTGRIVAKAFGWRPASLSDSNAPSSSIQGVVASGQPVSGNPILTAGNNAGNVQTISVDSSGRQVVVGPAAGGGAITGFPVNVQGSVASGSAVAGENPLSIGVSGPTNVSNWSAANNVNDAATGASVGVTSQQVWNGATFDKNFYCPNTSTFSVASATTQIVAASGSTKVRICSFSLNPSTVTAGNVDIVYGTGASCGTGTTTLSGAYTLPASAVVSIPGSMASNGPLITPASQAVCVRTTTATVAGFLTWAQY